MASCMGDFMTWRKSLRRCGCQAVAPSRALSQLGGHKCRAPLSNGRDVNLQSFGVVLLLWREFGRGFSLMCGSQDNMSADRPSLT